MDQIRDGDRRLAVQLWEERRALFFKASVVGLRRERNPYARVVVARRLGVSKYRLERWEKGHSHPTQEQRARWCAALDLDFVELLKGLQDASNADH